MVDSSILSPIQSQSNHQSNHPITDSQFVPENQSDAVSKSHSGQAQEHTHSTHTCTNAKQTLLHMHTSVHRHPHTPIYTPHSHTHIPTHHIRYTPAHITYTHIHTHTYLHPPIHTFQQHIKCTTSLQTPHM